MSGYEQKTKFDKLGFLYSDHAVIYGNYVEHRSVSFYLPTIAKRSRNKHSSNQAKKICLIKNHFFQVDDNILHNHKQHNA